MVSFVFEFIVRGLGLNVNKLECSKIFGIKNVRAGGATSLIISRPHPSAIRAHSVRCPSRFSGKSVPSADGQMHMDADGQRTDSARMRTDGARMRTDGGRTAHGRRTDTVS